MKKLEPEDWKVGIDPYVFKLISMNWGYYAKTCEAVAELYTSKGLKKAYDRGYRAGRSVNKKKGDKNDN